MAISNVPTIKDEVYGYPIILNDPSAKGVEVSLVDESTVRKREVAYWGPSGSVSWRLEREYAALVDLHKAGCDVPEPLNLEKFPAVPESEIETVDFTMRRLPGYSLDVLHSGERAEHIEDFLTNFEMYLLSALNAIEKVHATGYLLGDIKPGTFIINGSNVSIVDLEFAYKKGELEENPRFASNTILNILPEDPAVSELIQMLTTDSCRHISFEDLRRIELSATIRNFVLTALGSFGEGISVPNGVKVTQQEKISLLDDARIFAAISYLDSRGVPITAISMRDWNHALRHIEHNESNLLMQHYGHYVAQVLLRKGAVEMLQEKGIVIDKKTAAIMKSSLGRELSARPTSVRK